ncbi:unnamed protein product [Paramecium octaurelia]|uniref:Sema domain-containing protein n=1 Tax=Paramecium octaurelia TaxID=43137 RepID=A0A8S1VQG3_PAROT|nr:unnamed protein product [Paramecium octaurelia]
MSFYIQRLIIQRIIKICLTQEGNPNRVEFDQELIRKLYDLLRANKACLTKGIEIRPLFIFKS